MALHNDLYSHDSLYTVYRMHVLAGEPEVQMDSIEADAAPKNSNPESQNDSVSRPACYTSVYPR